MNQPHSSETQVSQNSFIATQKIFTSKHQDTTYVH